MRVGKRLVFVNTTVIPTMCFKVRRLERGWFSQNQPSIQPWTLRYDSWNGVGFRKTYRHSNHRLWYTKVRTELVFAKPTAIPTICFNIRRLERGWLSQNQPSFQLWTSRYESWNGVGFRKTNRHSNLWLKYTKVGRRLVFANPTVNPTVAAHVWGLENGWFSSIQPSFQRCTLRYEGWNAVGFRKSNCQSNRCRSCMRVGKRLVFVNPTVIPTMCFKVQRLERGWFPQNQPSFQPWTLRNDSWNGVGFRKTNSHSNHRLWYTKVGTWLVFAKPTAIPTMGFNIRRLERGRFSQDQPTFQPWAIIYESWNGVGFRKTTAIPTMGFNIPR